MAVTITQTPSTYSPSDSPIVFAFRSTQTGQANFSFIVETYVNAVKVSEDQVFPEAGSYAHINVSDIVSSSINDPVIPGSLFQNSGTNGIVYVKVFENYGSPPSNQASETSSSINVFKAVQSDSDYNPVIFQLKFKNKLFLTDWPREYPVKIMRYTDAMVNFMSYQSEQLTIELFDNAGNSLETFNTTQNYPIWQLNFLYLGDEFATPIDDVAYFTVKIGSGEALTFELIDVNCNNPVGFSFLNEYGAYDSFVFDHNHESISEVESLTYKRQFGGWNGSSYSLNPIVSGVRGVRKIVNDKGKASTSYLQADVQAWLVATLINSPEVYELMPNRTRPVNITTSSYRLAQDNFDELISEEIEYDYSNDHKSIRL